MTVIELVEACHRSLTGLIDSQWTSFGNSAKLLIIGREDLHWATAVVDVDSLLVAAVEIPNSAWWADVDHRDSWIRELESKQLVLGGREVTESEILSLLSELK